MRAGKPVGYSRKLPYEKIDEDTVLGQNLSKIHEWKNVTV